MTSSGVGEFVLPFGGIPRKFRQKQAFWALANPVHFPAKTHKYKDARPAKLLKNARPKAKANANAKKRKKANKAP